MPIIGIVQYCSARCRLSGSSAWAADTAWRDSTVTLRPVIATPCLCILRPRKQSIVMSTFVYMSVCPRGYLRNDMRDIYQFLWLLPTAVAWSSSALRQDDEIPRERANLGVSSPLTMHFTA